MPCYWYVDCSKGVLLLPKFLGIATPIIKDMFFLQSVSNNTCLVAKAIGMSALTPRRCLQFCLVSKLQVVAMHLISPWDQACTLKHLILKLFVSQKTEKCWQGITRLYEEKQTTSDTRNTKCQYKIAYADIPTSSCHLLEHYAIVWLWSIRDPTHTYRIILH